MADDRRRARRAERNKQRAYAVTRNGYYDALDKLCRNKTPEPSRITCALDACGLYGPEVDEACGVAEPAVDLWESGELVPTYEQIERLAALTGYAVRFFYGEPMPSVEGMFICENSGGF